MSISRGFIFFWGGGGEKRPNHFGLEGVKSVLRGHLRLHLEAQRGRSLKVLVNRSSGITVTQSRHTK